MVSFCVVAIVTLGLCHGSRMADEVPPASLAALRPHVSAAEKVQMTSGSSMPKTHHSLFAGLSVTRDHKKFDEGHFWGRDLDADHHAQDLVVDLQHKDDEEEVVFSAEYNYVNGVSDAVNYDVDTERFCVGCGRGSGWHEDEELHLAYDGDRKEYATRADYDGVGYFKIDRGHQCPVGSFNSELTPADLTNMPSNLSPQNVELNQKKWKFLEMEVREHASSEYLQTEDDEFVDIEVLTGPLYQLPELFFASGESEGIDAGEELWNQQFDYWCNETVEGKVEHRWLEGKKKAWKSTTKGRAKAKSSMQCVQNKAKRTFDPNNMWVDFIAKEDRTPLRVPLGYYKVFVVPKGTRADKTNNVYCAFILDQVGQCALTSLEALADAAHIDLSKTPMMNEPHRTNPYFCLPPGGTLRKKDACAYLHQFDDLDDVKPDAMLNQRAKELAHGKK